MAGAEEYVSEILKMAGYNDSEKIAKGLVLAFPMHEYVINPEKASELGLHVRGASEFGRTWDVMRYWLGKYVLEQTATHFIRYALPASRDTSCEKPTRRARR